MGARAHNQLYPHNTHTHSHIHTIHTRAHLQLAKRELAHLRQEARESTKLLEDKKALESKVRELQDTLNLVQDQRNELRQQVGWVCEAL